MTDFQLTTPVAFLIFNRPDTTARVFEAIRQAKPPKLLVVADGPRPDRADDIEKCNAARAIIEGVDWDCEVLTDYSDVNLGCKNRVSSGLDWVFGLVEEGIILEDDCVPHPSFFRFCQELLDYYRDDKRIMAISGDNFQFGRNPTEYSYYFSRYPHCWGWATWRRAWKYYDVEMKLWPKIETQKMLSNILQNSKHESFWRNIFKSAYEGMLDSWNACWCFACWIQNGLTIIPDVNLVTNIGFGPESTHTLGSKSKLANIPAEIMAFPLKHPEFIIRNCIKDNFTEAAVFSGRKFNVSFRTSLKKVLNKVLLLG